VPSFGDSSRSSEELHKERWIFRLATYADLALLLLLLILLPRDWVITSVSWFVLTFSLLGWTTTRARKRMRRRQVVASPEQLRETRRDHSRRVKRAVAWELVGGIVLAFAGIYNPVALIFSGLLRVLSGAGYFLARKLDK
jgi:hypothetical protein